jgi:hypothetical protein
MVTSHISQENDSQYSVLEHLQTKADYQVQWYSINVHSRPAFRIGGRSVLTTAVNRLSQLNKRLDGHPQPIYILYNGLATVLISHAIWYRFKATHLLFQAGQYSSPPVQLQYTDSKYGQSEWSWERRGGSIPEKGCQGHCE